MSEGGHALRLLDHEEVSTNADMDRLVTAIEAAFAAYARGEAQMPAKSYIDLPAYNGDFRSMPAYLRTEHWDAAGIKWVNVHPDNPASGTLPTVIGTMIYSDPATGRPLAIMDGTTLTRLRTGAAAAVATDQLAVPDARSLGIVGAGAQSYTQLEGIATVRPIEEVVIADIDEAAVQAFHERYADSYAVRAGSPAEAAQCDVLSTVTPVTEPIVELADLGARTHVNAMGADAPGKQELATEVVTEATVFIDDYDQTTHSGEINVAWAAGVFEEADIQGELGDVVVGTSPGRQPEDGVTVFDSTGLAIQDIAAAHVVYERAERTDSGYLFEMIDG